MKGYVYSPQGVCSKKIYFKLDDEKRIHELVFEGGCNGNLKAIGRLTEGKSASEIADILRGNQCGGRGTSCADQLSKALEKALADMENG
ncbi:MAG: TIGR03905 family TSCPD domain-containing protein [Lachnospiraceae bacterium]|nr:TIGR03905 family TSCPD domain-containing protein [Lachnospiraceae bacterium]